ncbi:transforming acidic coiled-coil-containing protein 3-like [Eucyclogobius newberryi]|uniref:transforming acidic coiled-coil-containing protein 3-like n=1 Tax=Eucyclogobius newberryi TaxID=166745 RepID=UPI003B58D6BC
MQSPPRECALGDEETEIEVPKASYQIDLENLDENFDPFASRGSKIPNSPPPFPVSVPELHTGIKSEKEDVEATNTETKDIHLEDKAGFKSPRKKQVQKLNLEENIEERSPTKPSEVAQDVSNFDDVPIPKTGSYKFDPEHFDESFNPFMSGGSKIPNSPTTTSATSAKPKLEANTESEIDFVNEEKKPVTMDVDLDGTPETKPAPRNLGRKKTRSKVRKQKEEDVLDKKVESLLPQTAQETTNFDDIPIPKTGAYKFDPENFDESFNPFASGGSQIPNSPTTISSPKIEPNAELGNDFEKEETKPVEGKAAKKLGARKTPKTPKEHCDSPSFEASEETSTLQSASSPAPLNFDDVPLPKTETYKFDPENFGREEKKPVTRDLHLDETPETTPSPRSLDENVDSLLPQTAQETTDFDDIPIPKTGAYKFDPDNFDESFNPFASGGSKTPNSPPPSGTIPNFEDESLKAKAVVLEFGLDEETVTKPPPKRLGARKTISKVKRPKPKSAEEESDSRPAEIARESSALPPPPLNIDDIPIPKKGSYNFDPEKFDEGFDPFKSGGSKIPNSPTSKTIPETDGQEEELKVKAVTLNVGLDEETVTKPPPKKPGARKTINKGKGLKAKSAEEKLEARSEAKETRQETPPPLAPPPLSPPPSTDDVPSPKTFNPKSSYCIDPLDELVDPFKASKSLRNEEEENKPGAEEEEKRRRETRQDKNDRSWCKVLTNTEETHDQTKDEVNVGTPEITQREHHATDEEKLASTAVRSHMEEEQEEELRTSRDQPTEGSDEKSSAKDESAPCWSQKHMDELLMKPELSLVQSPGSDPQTGLSLSEMDEESVLTLLREEILTKELEVEDWKRRFEESRVEVQEMRKIVAEYEKTVAQMIEDDHQQKTLSCSLTVGQLTLERDQALSDLSSVERSFSELFRRYENMKGVLEGFKKNEDVLKRCAQEYLQRIKQEEHRYQTLKAHAEEKLHKANEEIAQVRSKAAAETVALGASLRKEQMKAESLERSVQQKNQEIEELTKICDELIAKLGPG